MLFPYLVHEVHHCWTVLINLTAVPEHKRIIFIRKTHNNIIISSRMLSFYIVSMKNCNENELLAKEISSGLT